MKKALVAAALAGITTLGFAGTVSAGGADNPGRAPGGQNHAAVASTLGGEVVSSLMPCHVAGVRCEG